MYLIRSKKLDLSSRKELKIEPGGGELISLKNFVIKNLEENY